MTPKDAVQSVESCATAVMSYRWLSALHPDPNGFHVVAVRKALTSLQQKGSLWKCMVPLGEQVAYRLSPALGHRSFAAVSGGTVFTATIHRVRGDRHPGVTCDRSGMNPIVGIRFHLRGHNYNLCQAEYDKLSAAEKGQYEAIPPPGGDWLKVDHKSGLRYLPIMEDGIVLFASVQRALFMDFLSCPQKDGQGQRTAAENTVFGKGLDVMGSFYASPRTQVLQHKRLPPGFDPSLPTYDQSGWCNFEQAVARLGQARVRLAAAPSLASRLMGWLLWLLRQLSLLVLVLLLLLVLPLRPLVLAPVLALLAQVLLFVMMLVLALLVLPFELLGLNFTDRPRSSVREVSPNGLRVVSHNGCLRADSFVLYSALVDGVKGLVDGMKGFVQLMKEPLLFKDWFGRAFSFLSWFDTLHASPIPPKEVCQRCLELILGI